MPAALIPRSGFARITTGLRARASGPGGLYNTGNIFGLFTDFLAFWLRADGREADAIEISRNAIGQTPFEGAEPAALILCYLLWLRADILLIK